LVSVTLKQEDVNFKIIVMMVTNVQKIYAKKMASVSSREKKGANARKKTIVAQKVSSVAVENARETTSVLE